MSILQKLKKAFPSLYDYYQHLERKQKIRNIARIKKLPFEQKLRMQKEIYEKKFGHSLDWSSLKTYTEKMQWEKMYHKDPIKTLLADKYAVRQWIEEKIGAEYLIPLYGVWNSFDEIDFGKLPNQFVLKTNHGTKSVEIVKDKAKMSYRRLKRKFDDWMAMDFAYTYGFQLHYTDIPRKIIAEKYLESSSGELQDYKFLCFNGVPKFCWVDQGRYSSHTRAVFDMDWTLQPWTQGKFASPKEPVPKPQNFEKMKEVATILCKDFSHVRVDLYNIDGSIYFGEMTFTNGSGMTQIYPNEYDLILGDMWHIDMKK